MSYRSLALTHLLLEMITSFHDLSLEGIIRTEIFVDLNNWQVNEHTSDLRSSFRADHTEDEVIDDLADLLLILLVPRLNGR